MRALLSLARTGAADGRNRTDDQQFTKLPLYQLSYVGARRGLSARAAGVPRQGRSISARFFSILRFTRCSALSIDFTWRLRSRAIS